MVADISIQPESLKFLTSGFCTIQDLVVVCVLPCFPFGFFFMLVLLLAPRSLPREKRPPSHQHEINTSTGEKQREVGTTHARLLGHLLPVVPSETRKHVEAAVITASQSSLAEETSARPLM